MDKQREWVADLHVHSRFSRATARNLNLGEFYVWASKKGISLLATGDFTHPAWLAELEAELIPAGPGIFRLRPEIEKALAARIPSSCRRGVRFIPGTEISCIYKKNDRVRKNHHCIFFPDFKDVRRFNEILGEIGNLTSDGRPILGIDSRRLLEIMLDVRPEGMFIPAHIWTPWFSLFGSKSGFDRIEECFEDLSDEIFAVETGLSSDVPMNRRVSQLESRALVSNSDAHSPASLGRNANLLAGDMGYFALRDALKSNDPKLLRGTLDMMPEEGKYHLDGHRKCGFFCAPGGGAGEDGTLCPECGRPLTLGVLHRSAVLADRPEGYHPPGAPGWHTIIPLPEILAEIFDVGVKSRTVDRHYQRALEFLGPEMEILRNISPENIAAAGIPFLDEAIRRMRDGRFHVTPGYDGQYGRIRVFAPGELEREKAGGGLFPGFQAKRKQVRKRKSVPPDAADAVEKKIPAIKAGPAKNSTGVLPPGGEENNAGGIDPDGLSAEQRAAVMSTVPQVIITAGPGAGKTRTLTRRIAHLIRSGRVSGGHIIAVTFTRRAAGEMRSRVAELLSAGPSAFSRPGPRPLITTFHGLCLELLADTDSTGPDARSGKHLISEEDRRLLVVEAMARAAGTGVRTKRRVETVSAALSAARRNTMTGEDRARALAADEFLLRVDQFFEELLVRDRLMDFDGLITETVFRLETDPVFRENCRRRCRVLLVDEFQDVNEAQYRLVSAFARLGADLFVIGDPDQAIYGFRGADHRFFRRFTTDWPDAASFRLTRNYRSARTILSAGVQVLDAGRQGAETPACERIFSAIEGISRVDVLFAPTEKSEAAAIGLKIEALVGGTGFHSMDMGRGSESASAAGREYAFSDIAVLYRSHAQGLAIADGLRTGGIPVQTADRKSAWDQPKAAAVLSALRIAAGMGTRADCLRLAALDGGGKKRMPGLPPPDEFRQAAVLEGEERAVRLEMLAKEPWASGLGPEEPVARRLDALAGRFGLAAEKGAGGNPADLALRRLISLAEPWNADLSGFLRSGLLSHDADLAEPGAQKVRLMTLHAAKGLEFPVVFIAGCEHGLLPYIRPGETVPADPEEERRLFYVGVTRAGQRLFFTHAARRTVFGRSSARRVSPYLEDIQAALLRREKSGAGRFRRERAADNPQLALF